MKIQKICLFFLTSILLSANLYAADVYDKRPKLKDLLKQILEAPSSTKGEKINSSRPFGDNNSKYLTADLEGTFAMDCDAMQLEKEDNYIIERQSYSKKSNEYSTTIKRGSENWVETTSTISTDKDTGLITEKIQDNMYRTKWDNLEYLIVSARQI